MTVAPLQSTGAPALAENPAGKGKSGITITDPGFASLLAMLLPGTLVPNPGLQATVGSEPTAGQPMLASQSPLVPTGTIAAVADPMVLAMPVEQQASGSQVGPKQEQAANQFQVPVQPLVEEVAASPTAMAITLEAMPDTPSIGAEPHLVTTSAGLSVATPQAPAAQQQATGGGQQEADGGAQRQPLPMATELPAESPFPPVASKAQDSALPDGVVSPKVRRIQAPEPAVRSESAPVASPISLQEGMKTPAVARAEVPSLDRLIGTVDVDRFADLVARSVRNSPDGQYTVSLRLHPESLGEVRLQIHLTGREVHTVMEVANPEARQALESRGDQLRQSLHEAGLTLAGFSVSTGHGRQSPRERHDAFADLLTGSRRIAPVSTQPTAEGPARIQRADRRGGRLDTMA